MRELLRAPFPFSLELMTQEPVSRLLAFVPINEQSIIYAPTLGLEASSKLWAPGPAEARWNWMTESAKFWLVDYTRDKAVFIRFARWSRLPSQYILLEVRKVMWGTSAGSGAFINRILLMISFKEQSKRIFHPGYQMVVKLLICMFPPIYGLNMD